MSPPAEVCGSSDRQHLITSSVSKLGASTLTWAKTMARFELTDRLQVPYFLPPAAPSVLAQNNLRSAPWISIKFENVRKHLPVNYNIHSDRT
jgi:hypothetical protein